MMADIMNLDVLRPKIEASEIAKMLESPQSHEPLLHPPRLQPSPSG
jgi:hypothetical protein